MNSYKIPESRVRRLRGGRVVLLGAIHVDRDGPTEVRQFISRERPDLVLLELDADRFYFLEARARGGPTVTGSQDGVPGDVDGVLVRVRDIQEELAASFGADVGAEMWAAAEAAKELDVPVDFIDVPITDTARLLESHLPEIRDLVEGDLPESLGGKTVDELVQQFKRGDGLDEVMGEFREEFPEISRILLERREEYMAGRVESYCEGGYQKIIVVVGAGHLSGLASILESTSQTGRKV
ncbi:MAG: TraB/GumN family protein [Promethearchaeota archaeon]